MSDAGSGERFGGQVPRIVGLRRGPERAHSSMGERGPQKQRREAGCMGVEGPSAIRNQSSSPYTLSAMDFAFSEEQEMLRASAREFLAKECPSSYVRRMMEVDGAWDEALWKKLAEMGWTSLGIP